MTVPPAKKHWAPSDEEDVLMKRWKQIIALILFSAILGVTLFWLHGYVETLGELAKQQLDVAVERAQVLLYGLGAVTLMLSLSAAFYVGRRARRGLRDQHLEVPRGTYTGAEAVRICRWLFGLAIVLALAGIGCAFTIHRLVQTLLQV